MSVGAKATAWSPFAFWEVSLNFQHGPSKCRRCWSDRHGEVQQKGNFQLVRDPGHWGASEPRTLVLGISKGNTQSRAFATETFDGVAFKGIRSRMLQLFQSVGLLASETPASFEYRFRADEPDFAFASVVRCSLTGFDKRKATYTADSPNVVPAFDQKPVGSEFVQNCVDQHLVELPIRTTAVLLLGNTDSYVTALSQTISRRRGPVMRINSVAYTSNNVLFVHLAHPSKGNGHFGAYLRGEGKSGVKRDQARVALGQTS